MNNYKLASEDEFTKEIEEYTASIPSSAYLGVAVAAMGVSVVCQLSGRGKWGNFIAQWVPTWLIIGLYNKLVKVEGHDQFDRGAAASRNVGRSSQRSGARMQLKEFINYRVETAQPTDSLQQVAEKMRELDIGSLPVCDGEHLVGVVTDRDITIRATAKGQDPSQTKVRDIMTPEVVYCFESDDVEKAAKKMQEHQVRRIFVVNENHDLVGVTSLGELATVTGDRVLGGETLERVSEESQFEQSERH
jgi:CBS domain-containing protein